MLDNDRISPGGNSLHFFDNRNSDLTLMELQVHIPHSLPQIKCVIYHNIGYYHEFFFKIYPPK